MGRDALQNPDQLASAQERRGQGLDCVRDSETVDRRAHRQIWNVDGYLARQRHPLGPAITLESPGHRSAIGGETILNAAVRGEIVDRTRRTPPFEVFRS